MKAYRSRPLRRKVMAALVAACYGSVQAAPVNPSVVAGQASFNQQGKTYTITNTPNAIINWQGFSIGADEVTRFIQQSADSKVLNRITGQDPTQILGSLQSNGKVFLINPNGVLFGAGARVDVAGLVASSLNISNADFLAGKNTFNGAANAGKVSNQGTITTPAGGQIFLIAPAVENSGIISTPNGEVVLAAGHSVQLFDSTDPNVQVVVSSPQDQALNLGQIVAQGGRVGVYGALVNQRGVINANSAVRGENGKIMLKATRTTLLEAGSTTSATGTGEGSNLNTGGDIRLLGPQVGLSGNAAVDASGTGGGGAVLVGGDYQGKNPDVPNAAQSYVGKDVVIRADATQAGHGGKVIVWGDQSTQMYGAISARGGAAGGNGGLVETSGHYLDMQGKVDTRAPKGANGTLLLDPADVYIAADAVTTGISGIGTLLGGGSLFGNPGAAADSLLLTSVLETALLANDVTISSANTTGAGSIKVLSPLLWVGSHNLTLQSDGDIRLNARIQGAGGLVLNAGGAIVQTTSPIDALSVTNLSAISAGSITLDNHSNIISGTASLVSNGGNVTISGASLNLGNSTAAGDLSALAANGSLAVSGALQANGTVSLQNQGSGDITLNAPQALNGSLAVTSQRDIALNSSLVTAANLTLSAQRNLSASGDVAVGGTFALQGGSWTQNSGVLPAFSAADFKLNGSSSFLRVLGGDGSAALPFKLADVFGLQGVGTLSAANAYVLNNDIDASGTAGWSGGGFKPLAAVALYSGVFDGAGHAISGLKIDRASEDNVGLFSLLGTGTISNLRLTGATVSGGANVGAVAGFVSQGAGAISNVAVDAVVTGTGNTGGLVGVNGGVVSGSHSSGTVNGLNGANASNIGGLVGLNRNTVQDAWSSATVDTHGQGYTGGLVGSNESSAAVLRSYATGAVSGTGEIIGGLVGDNRNSGSITLSYATGAVSGGRNVGGLVGRNTDSAVIQNAYATGAVSGNLTDTGVSHGNIGGLVGDLYGGSVSNVYSSGTVTGNGFYNVRGAVGSVENGTLAHAYFDATAADTINDAAGAIALSTADMKQSDSYYGFDLSGVWRVYDGHLAPQLKNFLTPYTVLVTGGGSVTKVYDGLSAAFSGSTGTLPSGIDGTLGFDGAVNAGTYAVGGLYSTRYDISYAGASAQLTIQPRTVSAVVSASKVYDGSRYLEIAPDVTLTNVVAGDNVQLNGMFGFADKNVGSAKPLSLIEGGLANNSHGNYILGGVSGTGSITPLALSIDGLSVNTRVYNGTTAATLSGTASVQGLYGDDVTLGGSGTATFNNKSVGAGKLVTVNAAGFTLSGNDAGNYVLVAPAALTGEITPLQLSLTGMTAASRSYNATANATVSGGALAGVIGGDEVGFTGISASFADKNVGVNKAVTVTGSLAGADANNYTVAMPTNLSASITPATVKVTLASREYNNATAASFSGASVGGVFSGDTVSLVSTGATGTYADKNVGVAKLVTLGGTPLGLSGADAGNYVIDASVSGDITARALSTWIGSGGGSWSASANWADGVAPDGSNVLAASLGNVSGVITYDASAGNTTLARLTSNGSQLALTGGKLTLTGTVDNASNLAGGLVLNGGVLEVQGALQANNAVLSSGSLTGVGSGSQISLTGLNQTGAVIDSSGAITITGAGNSGVAVGNVRAHSIALDATSGGAITQTANSQLVADSLSATAGGGNIVLNNANNHVSAFTASTGGVGNIGLTNTVSSGELALGPLNAGGNIIIDNHGGIHTTGAIAGGALVSVTAHSPVTINNSVSGTDIVLSASTDIVLNGGSQLNSNHSIGLTAGTNIVLGGTLTVPAGGSISAVATNGNISSQSGTQIISGGSPVTLSAPNGSVNTQGTVITGVVPTINDGVAAAQAAAAAAAKAAADAAAKAAADAAAKAAADAAAKAAADAAAKAAADAAAKAAADAAAKAAADAAAKAAADAAAKAAADAAAQAAADAAAKAAADAAAAQAAAKAAADAAAKAAADAAAQAAADAAAKAAADAAAQAAAEAAAKAAADAAAQAAATKAAADAAAAAAAQGGQPNRPVAQALNSTVNLINTAVNSTQAGGPMSRPGDAESSGAASSGGTSGNSAPDEKVPGDKLGDGAARTAGATEQGKKMYCN